MFGNNRTSVRPSRLKLNVHTDAPSPAIKNFDAAMLRRGLACIAEAKEFVFYDYAAKPVLHGKTYEGMRVSVRIGRDGVAQAYSYGTARHDKPFTDKAVKELDAKIGRELEAYLMENLSSIRLREKRMYMQKVTAEARAAREQWNGVLLALREANGNDAWDELDLTEEGEEHAEKTA